MIDENRAAIFDLTRSRPVALSRIAKNCQIGLVDCTAVAKLTNGSNHPMVGLHFLLLISRATPPTQNTCTKLTQLWNSIALAH